MVHIDTVLPMATLIGYNWATTGGNIVRSIVVDLKQRYVILKLIFLLFIMTLIILFIANILMIVFHVCKLHTLSVNAMCTFYFLHKSLKTVSFSFFL